MKLAQVAPLFRSCAPREVHLSCLRAGEDDLHIIPRRRRGVSIAVRRQRGAVRVATG